MERSQGCRRGRLPIAADGTESVARGGAVPLAHASAAALEFWDQLAKHTKLTREDLRDEATVALLAGDRVRAERAINELTTGAEAAPADWLLAAQLAGQKS